MESETCSTSLHLRTTAKPEASFPPHDRRYLLQAALHPPLDLRPEAETDVYWAAADIGWVTGHSYIVYGPLANGTTGVMYEGTPDYPSWERWWEIVERYKVTILYTAPTAIRAHMKQGAEYAGRHDLSSLRLLGTVGEPINPRPGSGTTGTSARSVAPSSTPGGRPRPAPR
jgi:acetyl-CoA synthetase